MKKIPVFIFLWMICFCPIISAQGQVWPGDVDNNGIVDHIDLLYLNLALGEIGPPRPLPEQGDEWEEKEFEEEWVNSFPDGTNYVYADCNGDGFISLEDEFIIRELNFDLTHGVVTPPSIPEGNPITHPTLRLNLIGEEIIEGNSSALVVEFGTAEVPVDNFYGIAFTIKYDPEIMQANFLPINIFDEEDIFWGNIENLNELIDPNLEEGEINVMLSRFEGGSTASGFGVIGTFFVVVEDNVVGISDPDLESSIYIEKVLFFDSNFNVQPVYGDSTSVTIFNDDLVDTYAPHDEKSLSIYPNPTQNKVWIDCKNQTLQYLSIYHHTGQTIFQQAYDAKIERTQINTENLPKGAYFIEIQTSNGIEIKNIILQ